MYILNAEKRDADIKAKKLRREGKTPISIYGGKLKETLLFQMPEKEAAKIMRMENRGNKLTLQIGQEQYHVILKELTFDTIKNQLIDISFQII